MMLLPLQSGDSSELAPRLPCKGKSVRTRGVSQTMPFLVIPRSLLRGGFIINVVYTSKLGQSIACLSLPAFPVKTRNFVRWGPHRALDETSILINLCF